MMPDGNIMTYTDDYDNFKTFYGKTWDEDYSIHILTQTDMAWDSNEKMWITSRLGFIELLDPNAQMRQPFDTEEFIPVRNIFIDDNDIIYMQRYMDNYDIISYDNGV